MLVGREPANEITAREDAAMTALSTRAGLALLALAVAFSPVLAADKPKTDAELTKAIDAIIDAELRSKSVAVSPRSSDAEFLRRVYLDIAGVIPTAEQAEAFLESKATDKREKLVEELLASPKYGERLADIWEPLLLPRNSDNRRVPRDGFRDWLVESFNKNTPWNAQVRELLTATGELDEKPAVAYFLMNRGPDKLTDSVSKLFLGVQLQCAQCHNHPFYDWKQDEYWGAAAFFMKVRLEAAGNKQIKNGESPGVTEAGGRVPRKQALPESAKMVPAKFPGGDKPTLNDKEPYRPVFAEWLTAKTNPFFAKAMVNRTWSQLFGRGLMNPVDDMQEGNEVSHPELLALLSERFARDFDLKALVRVVVNTKAYQRSSVPSSGNEKDHVLLSHYPVKVLSAEQLFDSMMTVLGPPPGGNGKPNKANAAKGMRGATAKDVFVAFFQGDEPFDATQYEAGIPQALRLMNGERIQQALARKATLTKGGLTHAGVVETLYLSTLSRKPTDAEYARLLKYIAGEKDPKAAYGDILWALMNSSEFTMNH